MFLSGYVTACVGGGVMRIGAYKSARFPTTWGLNTLSLYDTSPLPRLLSFIFSPQLYLYGIFSS
jgi:hypothetical protein